MTTKENTGAPSYDPGTTSAKPQPEVNTQDNTANAHASAAINPGYSGLNALKQQTGYRSVSDSLNNQSAAEVSKLLAETYAKVSNETSKGARLSFLPIQPSELDSPCVVAFTSNGKTTSYYTFLLEALCQPLSPRINKRPDNQGTYQIEMPVSRYISEDATLINYINEVLGALDETRGQSLISMGYVVVTKGTDLTEPTALAPYLDSAICALESSARFVESGVTSNKTAALMLADDISLVARNTIRPGSTLMGRCDRIVASDFMISLCARNRNLNRTNQPISLHGGLHNDVVLAEVAGILDFAWRPLHANEIAAAGYTPDAPVPAYDPYIVLTAIGAPSGTGQQDDIITQLLGMVLPVGLGTNWRWVDIMARSSMDSGLKVRLETMALEYNPMDRNGTGQLEKIEIGSSFHEVLAAARMFCHDTIGIAIDVEHGGPFQWAQTLLLDGDLPDSLLRAELNHFSGGLFSEIYSGPIFAMEPTEILLGNYTDAKGNIRDIRSIDYLATLEASGGDETLMTQYSAGRAPGAGPIAVDEFRELILKHSPNATITGTATRYYLNGEFVNALDQMLSSCTLRTDHGTNTLAVTLEGLPEVDLTHGRPGAYDPTFKTQLHSKTFHAARGPGQIDVRRSGTAFDMTNPLQR